MAHPLKQQLDSLILQRDVLEIEADAIHSELTSPGVNGEPPAGIKDSLIDSEGIYDKYLFEYKTLTVLIIIDLSLFKHIILSRVSSW